MVRFMTNTPIEAFFAATHNDLVTPDGKIIDIQDLPNGERQAHIRIEDISTIFTGYHIEETLIKFNLKSTLAQLGVEAKKNELVLDPKYHAAEVTITLSALSKTGRLMLDELIPGCYVGKLFAADPKRRVRNPIYLSRMFGRSDRWGRPLLSLGGLQGGSDLVLEKIDGRTIAYLTLQPGKMVYDSTVDGFLPTVQKGLVNKIALRELVGLHQVLDKDASRLVEPGDLLIVRTQPLHIRTVYAQVAEDLLPEGYHHTAASVLEPDTQASGNIYELYGKSDIEITDIPLEFYTLEPYREFVFFSDRDQLQTCIENDKVLFDAFKTAPKTENEKSATYIVKGQQLLELKPVDWIVRKPVFQELPGLGQFSRQALMIDRYLQQQPSYPFLKAIEDERITSHGVLLALYFPTPFMKTMLLSDNVQRNLKGIYFQYPSQHFGDFFSQEDRALLHDLFKFAIPVFWVDRRTGKVLRYIEKPLKESGLFVPLSDVDRFLQATIFGIYGSNLLGGNFENELSELLSGVLALRSEVHHELLHKDTPLALVTGGGPGSMEVGNRIAKELGILSCANVVDFSHPKLKTMKEQEENPYLEAKMTYRLGRLVERQAEFNLDFAIFVQGGIGTDFELLLEEVRRKTGAIKPLPVILFGDPDYWRAKITSRFQINRKTGTTKGSEWVSNCFFCIQKAEQGVEIYRAFFNGTLPLGEDGPIYDDGFAIL